jgi:hypothetical protein
MANAVDQDEQTVADSARGLVKSYGDIEAVRGIDLEVLTGETFGFLGPQRSREVDDDLHALHVAHADCGDSERGGVRPGFSPSAAANSRPPLH